MTSCVKQIINKGTCNLSHGLSSRLACFCQLGPLTVHFSLVSFLIMAILRSKNSQQRCNCRSIRLATSQLAIKYSIVSTESFPLVSLHLIMFNRVSWLEAAYSGKLEGRALRWLRFRCFTHFFRFARQHGTFASQHVDMICANLAYYTRTQSSYHSQRKVNTVNILASGVQKII